MDCKGDRPLGRREKCPGLQYSQATQRCMYLYPILPVQMRIFHPQFVHNYLPSILERQKRTNLSKLLQKSKKIYAEHYLFCLEFASSGIASNLQAALFSWEITRGLTKTSSTDFMFGLLAGSLLVQRIPSLNTRLISSR